MFVARKLKELVRAGGRRWNPKKGSSERFEDYSTQLAALREIAKILDIYPKDPEDAHRAIRIDVSGIALSRERVSDGEQSIGTATGDGRERCER